MFDQQIDELAPVDQADAREAWLQRHVGGGILEVGGGDESALSTERDGLPKLPHRVRTDLGAELVTFGLHKDLDLGEVGDVQLPRGVDAAIARLASDLRALEAQRSEQMPDQNLELLVVQL